MELKGISVRDIKKLVQDVALIKNILISEKEELLPEYLETFEIMSNPETMKSIRQSKEDIKEGRVKRISSVQDMLKEL